MKLSDEKRKAIFASKINRDKIYKAHFHPKGTRSVNSEYDISGLKIHKAGMIQIPNKKDLLNPHRILVGNKKDFDRIMDNMYNPEYIGTRKGNKKIIITGANQYFKPAVVTKVELDEMVSRRMKENFLWQIMAEKQGKDVSKMKTVHGFPLTSDGLMRQRKAMYVGTLPINPKKERNQYVKDIENEDR